MILSRGAYGSPRHPLRSGIGPADHLREIGIPVNRELPGVGEHLQDHPAITLPGPFPIRPEFVPDSTIHCPVMILAQSSQSPDEIDLHIYHGQRIEQDVWSVWIDVSVQFARSRDGPAHLGRSRAPPAIDHRHLTDARDLEAICDGCEMAADIFDSAIVRRSLRAEPKARTWRESGRIARFCPAAMSARCSTRPAPARWVRPAIRWRCRRRGRVHGVAGLRVADASIFPQGPRGNTHGPTVASAEVIAWLLTRVPVD